MDKQNEYMIDDLIKQLAFGDVAIFVGSGVSASTTKNHRLCSWRGLLEDGIARCESVVGSLSEEWSIRIRQELQSDDMDDLLSVAHKVETKLRRTGGEYERWLQDSIGSLTPVDDSAIKAIDALGTPIITTNYDSLIEQVTNKPACTWKQRQALEQVLHGSKPGIVHVHGFYENPDTVVLGIRSYEEILHDEFTQTMMRSLRALHTLLFIGFGEGLQDPNFAPFMDWSAKTFDKSYYRHFVLTAYSNKQALQNALPKNGGMQAISYGANYSDLVPFLNSLGVPRSKLELASKTKPAKVGAQVKPNYHSSSKTCLVEFGLADYYKTLREIHGFIRFVEMPSMEELADVRIEQLFIEPMLCYEEFLADRHESSWSPRIKVSEALTKSRKVVLLGDPGSGKSTLISSLTYRLCSSKGGGTNPDEFTAQNDLVPIPMILRDLKLRADLTWESLLDAFLAHRTGKLIGSREKLEAVLRSGKALVMLDGLDEIGNIMVRTKLKDSIQVGMSNYSDCFWVLTSRIIGYDEVPFHVSHFGASDKKNKGRRQTDNHKLKLAELLYVSPFSQDEIKRFSEKWFSQHETDSAIANESALGLVAAINANEGTHRLARIPYLLTLIAIIYRKNTKLPHGRADLYGRIASAYLETIDLRRNLEQLSYSLSQKMRWLAEVGFQMQLRRSKAKSQDFGFREILASGAQVQAWLCSAMESGGINNAPEEARKLLEYFAKRSGLLLPKGENQFAFMHLSLQEFFAACYLELKLTASRFANSRKTSPTNDQIKKWANDSSWKETFVLLFERLASKEVDESEGLFSHIFNFTAATAVRDLEPVSARLAADLTVDQSVLLTASTRQSARRLCWNWIFQPKAQKDDSSHIGRSNSSYVTQILLSEKNGNITEAWRAAAFNFDSLFATITNLDFGGCRDLSDIQILKHFSKLTNLSLADCYSISDFTALESLSSLRELTLSGCFAMRDLNCLKKLHSLQRLHLQNGYGLTNWQGLSALEKLNSLSVGPLENQEAVDHLAPLTNLRSLVIEVTQPFALDSLARMQKLQRLVIQSSKDSSVLLNVTPLKANLALTELHFHGFKSRVDLTPLTDLPNLRLLCTAGSKQFVIPDTLQAILGSGRLS